MSEDIKSIKLELPFCTPDGDFTLKIFTVTFKNPKKEQEDFGKFQGYGGNLISYIMSMSVVLPDEIFNKLSNNFIPRKSNGRDGTTYNPESFKKTITSNSLESVTTKWRDIMLDYQWLVVNEKRKLQKVIFYEFWGKCIESEKSYWDGKKIGSNASLKYGFLIGYISEDGKLRFNEDKKMIIDRDGESSKWSYVEYTEERESFFIDTYKKHEMLMQKLADFQKNISPKTIDDIISKNKLLGI